MSHSRKGLAGYQSTPRPSQSWSSKVRFVVSGSRPSDENSTSSICSAGFRLAASLSSPKAAPQPAQVPTGRTHNMPLPSEAELETQIKNTSGARRRFVRPSPPRGLTWRSDKGLIVWEAPADANAQPGTMYYNLYLDTDSDQGLTLQIPFDQTSVTPPRAAQRVFLSAFNATSQLESPRVLLQQNVGINEANIISGGVGPASVNSPAILVDGLTLTSNSPSAGDVAWSVCTVYWNGTAYTILAGNTSSPFVIWNTGSGSFTGTSSYTPSTNIYLIATNVSGTGDTAWNKVANSHITSSHVLSGSLTGSSLNLGTLAVGPNGSATFDGFTWTANSPSAGDIAYSAGTVSYKG